MARMPVQFRLNGSDRAAFIEPAETLLITIRRGLNEFAPKFGCGQGTCGVCTVLIDGEPRLGCLTLSVTCEGRSIETAAASPTGRRCIRCRPPSWTISPRNAASARPAC